VVVRRHYCSGSCCDCVCSPTSSMPTTPDLPLKRRETMTEAVRASTWSSVIAKRRRILQFDGGNMSSSSCDTVLNEDTLSPTRTNPLSPLTLVLLMSALPRPSMAALPTPGPYAPPPWSIHLRSYSLRVICRFALGLADRSKIASAAGQLLARI
jgi:hypothetical protein